MSKPSATRLPITDAQREQIRLLAGCTFLPASWDKRFVRALKAEEARGDAATLTDSQCEWLDRLTHRYRRQHRRCPCLACLNAGVTSSHERLLFGEEELR